MSGECERWQILVGAALDGELPSRRARRLEEHLASCPRCAAHREALLRLREALHGSFDLPLPDGALGSYEACVWTRVDALRGERAAAASLPGARLWARLTVGAVLACALVAGGLLLSRFLAGRAPTRVNYVATEEEGRYAIMVAGGEGYSAVWLLEISLEEEDETGGTSI